ncbi:hypothetical protein ACFGVS_29085 [Mucilaginibacter sp. AW1-7]|uniref:hypothetical protein n=1 Tax=Mucilaginibacter sp. AW1-7 TaxID=3349874 RepID=UPI003F740495
MKKNLLSLAIMLFGCHFSYAQWTTTGTPTTITNTVGIGTTTPAYPFHIYNTTTRSTNSGSYADFGIESFNNTGWQGSHLYFGRARGTATAPLATISGDYLGWLDFYGHDGTSFQRSGQIVLVANGAPSSGIVPGAFLFSLAGSDGVTSERMRINSAGNVGIGTTNPTSNLQIFESSDSKPGGVVAPTKSVFKLMRNGTSDYSYNESAEFRIGHGGPSLSGSKLDLFVNGASNTNGAPDQQVMSWLYNGNVGIGTTTPAAPLHVSKLMTPGAVTEMLRLEIRGNNSDELAGEGAAINFYTPVTPSPDALGAQIYSFRESAVNATSTTSLRFATNNAGTVSDKLVISGSGNVGIGTADTKGYKLGVNGGIIATAVTVKLYADWADYVFNKDYRLPSLTEVKTYIDQNHHLPEIPSAQQVEKDGINLGEMNKLLMKKVEELTLYLIEKDKQLEAQNKKINDQEKRISKLEKPGIN